MLWFEHVDQQEKLPSQPLEMRRAPTDQGSAQVATKLLQTPVSWFSFYVVLEIVAPSKAGQGQYIGILLSKSCSTPV